MELQFQQNPPRKHQYQLPAASKTKPAKAKTTKFVGVRQRPSGRWVAEIKDTTQKIRMWLGTFETSEEAARAYDAAAFLLRGANTRTNFSSSAAAADSPLASRVRNLLNLKKQSKNRAPPKTNINPHPPGAKTTPYPAPVPPPPPPPCIDFNPCSSTSTSAESKICSTSSSSSNTSADAPYHERKQQDGNLGEELDLVWPSLAPLLQEPSSWALDCGELLLPPPRAASEEMAELERMKVERQFSASLYAMNGVQEYLDMVQVDPLPLEALWDLPPPWHLSRRT